MKNLITRSATLTLLGGFLMAIYQMLNKRSETIHQRVEMPDWVPFWPLMTIPYLLMLIVPWLAALTLKEKQHFQQYLLATSISFAVIVSIWYLHPTEMLRPETPEGSIYEIHRILVVHDNPVCIVPCGHIIGPITIVFLLSKEKPWLPWLLPLLGFGIIAIATTWQHRPLDILTGSSITFTAVFLTHLLFHRIRKDRGRDDSLD